MIYLSRSVPPGNSSWIPPPEWNQHLPLNGDTDQDVPKDRPLYFRPALSTQNVWLFNVTADPEERLDISESRPEVVRQLLDRLLYYNSTAVPPRYPKPDPNSNPKKHGGVWGPWE